MLRSVVSRLWVASLAVLVTPTAHAQSTTEGAGAAAVDPRDDIGVALDRGVGLLDERIVAIGRHFADVRFAGASTSVPMGASDLWLGAFE